MLTIYCLYFYYLIHVTIINKAIKIYSRARKAGYARLRNGGKWGGDEVTEGYFLKTRKKVWKTTICEQFLLKVEKKCTKNVMVFSLQ